MATVVHSTLTGTDLHEPKGVASASANQVYRANGSGSGTWGKVGQLNLDGVSSTTTFGKFVATNGTGGFVLADTAHGTCYYATTTIPQTIGTITSTGTALLISTTAKGTPQSITEGTDGRLTYTGTNSIDLDVVYNISFDITSSSNKNVKFYVSKNLALIQPESTSYLTARSGEVCFASGHADIAATTNDFIYLFAAADVGDSFTLRVYSFSFMATTAGA